MDIATVITNGFTYLGKGFTFLTEHAEVFTVTGITLASRLLFTGKKAIRR